MPERKSEPPSPPHLPRGDFAPRLRLLDRDGDDVTDAPALAALVDALGDLGARVVRDLELRAVGDHLVGARRRRAERAGSFLHKKREKEEKSEFSLSADSSLVCSQEKKTEKKNEKKNIDHALDVPARRPLPPGPPGLGLFRHRRRPHGQAPRRCW